MTQYSLVLKVCNHRVSVHSMCDEFSNKQIEKSYDAIFWGMISKTKIARHTSELQQALSNPKVS